MGHTQEITKKRKEIIQKVISEKGFTRKSEVREYIQTHEQYKHLFQFSRTQFNALIVFDFDHITAPQEIIKGTSTLKDSKGNKILEWVKTSIDKDKQLEMARIAVEELTKTIEPIDEIPLPQNELNENLLNQYTITDYHIGMMAIEMEGGDDWNEDIAAKLIVDWFAEGIKRSPDASQCVFAQIGDFLHFDSIEAVTPTNRHLLDASTRFSKLVRIAIQVVERIIRMLLLKYNKVHVILAEGNHDISSSIWMRESFSNFFKRNRRVSIDQTVVPFYCHVFGDVCLFYHHAHKKKIKELSSTLVAIYKEEFGKSTHVFAHTGHLHHEKLIEDNLMILEQHPTLSAADAYASRSGHKSKRSSKIITYHKRFGEVSRISINPQMLEK